MGGCCELKKARGGLNSLCSGGGWLIKRVYRGVVDVIVLTVRGECGRVNI